MKRRDWYKRTYKDLIFYIIKWTFIDIIIIFFIQLLLFGFGVSRIFMFLTLPLVNCFVCYDNYQYLIKHTVIKESFLKLFYTLIPEFLLSAFVIVINLIPMKSPYGLGWSVIKGMEFFTKIFHLT